MSVLGKFLEFAVRTPDILESLHFYKTLGFTELETGDVWSHKYSVVSDGELNIGMHDSEFPSPSITYVHPDLARHARKMTDHGFEFSTTRLSEDSFNEIGLTDRDGHYLSMVEARTFSRGDVDDKDSVCGSWFELTLPVRDVLRAAQFWAPIAPQLLELRETPTTHMRFAAEGVPLGLSESIGLNSPSLCFRCNDTDRLFATLAHNDIRYQKYPGFEGALAAIRSPEGTVLMIFDKDFLGESYEVTESDGDSD